MKPARRPSETAPISGQTFSARIPWLVSVFVNAALVALLTVCHWSRPVSDNSGEIQVSLDSFFSAPAPEARPKEQISARRELEYSYSGPPPIANVPPLPPLLPSQAQAISLQDLQSRVFPPPPALVPAGRYPPRNSGQSPSGGGSASHASRTSGGTRSSPSARKAGELQVEGGKILVVMVTDGPMTLVSKEHREELRRLASPSGSVTSLKDEHGARLSESLAAMMIKKASEMSAETIYWITPLANESNELAVRAFRIWLRETGTRFYLCSWGYPSEDLLAAVKESGGGYEQLCFHKPDSLEVRINPSSLEEVEQRIRSVGEEPPPRQPSGASWRCPLLLLYRTEDFGVANRIYTGRFMSGKPTDGVVVKLPGLPTPVNLFRDEMDPSSWETAVQMWAKRRY